ncbi:GTPase activating protein (GAP) for Rho1p [Coemansia erecta]|uniref:GTPase activating protein (GAP) for Rho1p n=1 Tax=Coemansia erecta TaxID=147472 RepID=A0A9W8CU13_9FUNG|nr:GTPase activating protein (GAP) for Rho1p [Coemansia erecta]
MFLRFKEKIKHLKPRSRPQSDNLTDKKLPLGSSGLPQHSQYGLPGMVGSPSFNKSNRGNSSSSEAQLFGMPLANAVRAAGVRVGTVAYSSEPCVVPSVVAVCGRHLWEQGQQTQGIFRVNGSMKRVQKLQDEFNERPEYGRHIEWTGYTLHDAATILRRYLISLPESVISVEHYSIFMDKYAETLPDETKARDYGIMIGRLEPEAQHTLLYMLELLSVFAKPENCERTLMNASNLAAVLQPCLLVHPGHVANPHEYSKAKDVVEFLIVNASAMYPGLCMQQQSALVGSRYSMLSAAMQRNSTISGEEYVVIGGPSNQHAAAAAAAANTEGSVYTGAGSGGNADAARGAGLIAFDYPQSKDDSAGPGGYYNGFMASDDGTTLATNYASIPAQQQQQQQQPNPVLSLQPNRWPSTTNSPDPISRSQTQPYPQQISNSHAYEHGYSQSTGNLGEMSATEAAEAAENSTHTGMPLAPPPPRGDSLVTMNMVMSTPVMGTTASGRTPPVRSLGSVTARLYDPSSGALPTPTPPAAPKSAGEDSIVSPSLESNGSGWNSGRSSAAFSSIQYQHTGSPQQYANISENMAVLTGGQQNTDQQQPPQQQQQQQQQPHDMRRVSGNARPRRSLSFIMPHTGLRNDDDDNGLVADRLSKDIMDRSSNAVRARRVAGDRRAAGYVNVPAQPLQAASTFDSAAETQPRPLPPVPVLGAARAGSTVSISSTGGFHMYPLPNYQFSGSRQSPSVVTARLQPGRANYSLGNESADASKDLDPTIDKYHTVGQVLHGGRSPTSHQQQQQHQLQPSMAQRFSPVAAGSGGRASWLSEDVPRDDYSQEYDVDGEDNRSSAAVYSQSFSEAQQQKLHPIGRADPMTVQQHQYHNPQSQLPGLQAATVSPGQYTADGAKFNRPQRQNNSGVANDSGRGDKVSMTRLKNMFRIGGNSSTTASSSKMSSMASISTAQPQPPMPPQQLSQQIPDMPIPRRPRQPSSSTHDGRVSDAIMSIPSQIHVAVPPGHLSIVYPDSPMSKADTLRRNSVDSLTKRLSQGSGHMDGGGRAYLVDPDQVGGINLHATPSNSTTLHSSSHMQQLQQHLQQKHHYSRRAATHVHSQTAGYIGDGESSSSNGNFYRRPGTAPQPEDGSFVLPDINNGSPLMPGLEFGASRESIYQQMQLQGSGSGGGGGGGGRRLSRRSPVAHEHAVDDDAVHEGNSPRRSRSLRNTITSLRRKLSKSSRGGSQHNHHTSNSSPDVTPSGGPAFEEVAI